MSLKIPKNSLRNNAKTHPAKYYFFVFRRKPHSFWRYLSPTIILQTNPVPEGITPISKISAAKQSKFYRRRDITLNLPDLSELRPGRNDSSLKAQWALQIPHRATRLSQPYHVNAIPSPDGSFSPPQIEEITRPSTLFNHSETHPAAKLVFDLDSTSLVLYGKQELARIGYNPQKWGRHSYHPILCFNGVTKDFWHGELPPGDAHTPSGILNFLKTPFTKLPPSVKNVSIRADRGFYDHKTIEYLEARKVFFIIAAKLTKPLKATLATLSYQVFSSGLEAAEFLYQPTEWEKE